MSYPLLDRREKSLYYNQLRKDRESTKSTSGRHCAIYLLTTCQFRKQTRFPPEQLFLRRKGDDIQGRHYYTFEFYRSMCLHMTLLKYFYYFNRIQTQYHYSQSEFSMKNIYTN